MAGVASLRRHAFPALSLQDCYVYCSVLYLGLSKLTRRASNARSATLPCLAKGTLSLATTSEHADTNPKVGDKDGAGRGQPTTENLCLSSWGSSPVASVSSGPPLPHMPCKARARVHCSMVRYSSTLGVGQVR